MKSKSSNLLLGITLLIAVSGLILAIWNSSKTNKTCYVDTLRLFNDYKLKIDLERKEDLTLRKIKSDADSIKNTHDMLMKMEHKDTAAIRQTEIQIAHLSKVFEDEYARSNKSINDEVWKRLNPDIDDFAKRNGLELLIGANGMGTVLYGSKNKDRTDDLLRFVNKKYENGE